jgi:methylenetetrahydrofolate dehydrogenase (NADP+)/methenyltetrahydrofolate cyclohydrolase
MRGFMMAARIIDGKEVAREIRSEIGARVRDLAGRGVEPGLAVILVGEDPASVSYVTGKEKACAELGIRNLGVRLPAQTTEDELVGLVRSYNADTSVHAILVQLPLPPHIDERRVIAAIAPEKDADGLTPVNVGRMVLEEPCFVPCTPAGVIELIRRSGVAIDGARAVVVGRSNLVGRPLLNLFIRKSLNATVTACHTGTRGLDSICREADILVACAGRPGLVKGSWIKEGACVIDVGVTRVEDASAKSGFRLKGDVDFEAASRVAGWITPVPGGVGPMTITMLLANTVEAANRAALPGRAEA